MRRRHIELDALFENDQNREFLQRIWGIEGVIGAEKSFGILDCAKGWTSQFDDTMTIEKYVALVGSTMMRLQTGWVSEEIRCTASVRDENGDHEALWVCPFLPENYNAVKRLFEEVYKRDMDKA